ncbi:MAG: winged helix-turn-helix domain-containing protein [Verrucomicrobia bacterium]|nr:winged helix-turn-helix domain-containing protein [Verrucomicrobiota bacterium]
MQNGARKILEQLKRRLERLAGEVDRLAYQVELLLADPGVSMTSIRSGAEREFERRAAAARGATRFERLGFAQVGGWPQAQFTIDNFRVGLSPKLAALLDFLARDDGVVEDDLVRWKTPGEIVAHLQKQFEGDFAPSSLPNLVYRLRRQLDDQNLHRDYIRVHPEGSGYRFALRRSLGPRDSVTGL